MVDFHEGMADKWYHERIVLAGGAAHSMTPALSLGLHAAWQGVVELANGLGRRFPAHLPSMSSDTGRIKRVFKAYQAERESEARTAGMISSCYVGAMMACQSTPWRMYNWAALIMPGDVELLDRQVVWEVRQGLTLDCLEERHFAQGTLRWVRSRTGTSASEDEREGKTVRQCSQRAEQYGWYVGLIF
jgi:hypothetical protein